MHPAQQRRGVAKTARQGSESKTDTRRMAKGNVGIRPKGDADVWDVFPHPLRCRRIGEQLVTGQPGVVPQVVCRAGIKERCRAVDCEAEVGNPKSNKRLGWLACRTNGDVSITFGQVEARIGHG